MAIEHLDAGVARVLRDLKEARDQLRAEIGGVLSDRYPGAATDRELGVLEEALGRELPGSYRAFLRVQNGFPEVDGETDVLGAAEVKEFNEGAAHRLLDRLAASPSRRWITRCVVIGRSEDETSLLLLDPEDVDPTGEWKVLEYDDDEGFHAEHRSFLEFLGTTASETREAVEESKEGQDLADLDF